VRGTRAGGDRRATLLRELVALTPQQPATVTWRIVELDHLLSTDAVPRTGEAIDIGCGDGTILELLRRHGIAWIADGIDLDEAEVALARPRGVYRRLHVAPGDAIPEPDAAYDVAFSNSVLEHIPGLPSTLAEAARLLRPGGRLIATVPSASFNACLRGPGILAPLLGRRRADYLRGIDARLAHVNLWSAERWRRELEAVGLRVVHMSAYLDRADVRRWERMSNWTAGLLYGFVRGRRSPLAMSRSMGVATGSRAATAMRLVATPLVRLAMRGHRPASGDPEDPAFGCLLIVAERTG
jgi:SAM-dependent methyltransferase